MSSVNHRGALADLIRDGDALLKRGASERALAVYREAAAGSEYADGELCLRLAKASLAVEDYDSVAESLRRLVEADGSFRRWHAAASLLDRLPQAERERLAKRSARAAVTGSYNTAQLLMMLRLAAFCSGVALQTYEGEYAQYQQDVLDGESALYRFGPDYVVMAVHDGALHLPDHSDRPDEAVQQELDRWRSLWDAVERHSRARIVQHLFARRPESAFGHLAARLPGTRAVMEQQLNVALGLAAGDRVLVVDCDRLAARVGKERWFDERYWNLAKQAVALDALPLLAKHTAAVIAGDVGLAKKCLVLDLDNTLWGGVIGEDGLAGIRLGHGAEGEAYVSFQEAILALKQRGVILAVCSKNDEAEAVAVFDEHPDMRIKRDDVACFLANWEPKTTNLTEIASRLNLGLDAFVYVDDNPFEREQIRRAFPEVDVLRLPEDPAGYARALLEYPFFEASTFTAEDARRSEQYRARAEAAASAAAAPDIDSFLRDLRMEALLHPFDEVHLPRVVQLIGKTNQFNLTSRRHSEQDVRAFIAQPDTVHFYVKLRDRFADHGLVGVVMARSSADALDIDTFLMSCRVIGRTLERTMLARLCHEAEQLGRARLRGTFVPTARNGLVRGFYEDHGFRLVDEAADGASVWEYDLAENGPIRGEFIEEERDGAARASGGDLPAGAGR